MDKKIGRTVRYGVSDWTFEFCDGSVEYITSVKKQSHTYHSGGEHTIEIESACVHNGIVDKVLNGHTKCVVRESFLLMDIESGDRETRTKVRNCFIDNVGIVSKGEDFSVCNLYISVKQE